MVKLSELCDITVGRTPARKEPDFWGGEHPWVSIADMNQGLLITSTKERLSDAGAKAGKPIPEGTVLLSFKLSIGKVSIAGMPLYTNEAIAALPIKDTSVISPRYLLWTLKSMDLSVGSNRAAMGATLNKAKLNEIEIPVPSLEEQERFTQKKDLLNSIEQKRERQRELFVELEKSVFIDMFGNPFTNPKKLPMARLGDVAGVLTGNSPPRADESNFGSAIEWIKSNNLGGRIATEADEWLSESGKQKARIAPARSALVTCIAGSPDSIGKCSLVDRDVAFNQQINAILPSENLPAEFILMQLKTFPELVRQKSSGGLKGLVSKSQFSEIKILNPDIGLVEEFMRIWKIFSLGAEGGLNG